jgi:hypothetical protein
MSAGRGGLADVLPGSLRALFAAAAASDSDTVTWTAASGRAFTWRVCRPPANVDNRPPAASEPTPSRMDLVAPLDGEMREPRVSTSDLRRRSQPGLPNHSAGSESRALIGRLVHRLFESGMQPDDAASVRARALVRAEERATEEDLDSVVSAALSIWNAMRQRADVADLLRGATVLSEVPFSLRVPADRGTQIVRGVIDSIVQAPGGNLTVVEFKTGAARPADHAQLDLYVRAARALFPEARVEGRLIYRTDAPDEKLG